MKVIFFFVVLLLFSCSSKPLIPADVLSPQAMQAVLWDMMRADEFVSSYERKDSTRDLKEKSIPLYKEIFRIHKTSQAQLKKSVDFYNLHPDLFKIVVDSLQNKKAFVLNDANKAPHRSDSLRARFDSARRKIKPALLPPKE